MRDNDFIEDEHAKYERRKPKRKPRKCSNFDMCKRSLSPYTDETTCYWCLREQRLQPPVV